jgi:DNA-binding NtrC family response regulator
MIDGFVPRTVKIVPPVAQLSHTKPTTDPPAEGAVARRVVRSLDQRTVLVVDDEANFLTLLDWFLTQRGYEVYTAANVDEALRLASERAFDIALLDVRIGASNDGLLLLDELTQRIGGIKIIMMTAFPTVTAIKHAFDKGASRFLTKPVDLQELAEAIKKLI